MNFIFTTKALMILVIALSAILPPGTLINQHLPHAEAQQINGNVPVNGTDFISKNDIFRFNASNYMTDTNNTQLDNNALKLQFSLIDVKTNQSHPEVTFMINITKISEDGSHNVVLHDLFQTQSAQPLVLNMRNPYGMELACMEGKIDTILCPYQYVKAGVIAIAKPDPIWNAWMQDPSRGYIDIIQPNLLQQGEYHASISILTIDNTRTVMMDPAIFHAQWTIDKNAVLVSEFPIEIAWVVLGATITFVIAIRHRFLATSPIAT